MPSNIDEADAALLERKCQDKEVSIDRKSRAFPMSSSDGAGVSATRGPQSKKTPEQLAIPLNVVFYLCLLSNILAASLAPIQDCDEVFNYWEPTHYLTHGHGLQTWEYSPEYSIRSWLYITIHAALAKTLGLFARTKTAQFYIVRSVLALVCTGCEVRLYSAVSRTLTPRVGVLFLIPILFSPGMFHASTALLPSSFTMYTSMIGLSAFLDWHGGLKTATGIMWFGIGALIGWPFAGALVLPFLLDEFLAAVFLGDMKATLMRFVGGVVKCLRVLCVVLIVESLFYQKLVLVPWNIVAYNIFGGSGKGPNIFGTEPWTYYLKNLLLNFNIWFALALASGPLLVLQTLFRSHKTSTQTLLRSATFILPFYMWLAIFTAQPHKEERFMYPAYPFLALNAAISLHLVLAYVGTNDPKALVRRIPLNIRFGAVVIFVMLGINISILRTAGVVTAYRAPMQVFKPLQEPNVAQAGDFVCTGKDWFRYPSSFFLPNNNLRLKFIKSKYDGLLPGEFLEKSDGLGEFPGTWTIPQGMNDQNEEDFGKYVDVSQCTFLLDSYFPGEKESELEPHYILDDNTWEKLSCKPFLDTRRTGILGRILWIPDMPYLPQKYRRQWGQYCLLKRRST